MSDESIPSAPNRSTRSTHFFNYWHRYRSLVRKRWWVPPITIVLGLGTAGFRLWHQPIAFVSVGRMMVTTKLQIPMGSVGSLYTEEMVNFLGTQAALMKSGTVLNRAFERVRTLKPELAPVEVDLQISVLPKTTIFNLVATGAEPQYTRACLEACMEEYINLKKEMRASTSQSTLAGITEQSFALERELKKYEDDLLAFQATNSVVFLQEQGNSAGSYLVQLNRQLAQLKTEFQLLTMLNLEQNLERQQKKAGLATPENASDDATSPANLLSSDYLKAKQEIQLKEAEMQEWSEYLKPRHPRMVAFNEDITRREKLLEIFKQQSLEQLENRRDSISLQTENLDEQIKEWEVKSLDVSKKMAEYDRIRANKQRAQSLYDRLLAAMQTLGMDKDINQDSVAVLERASVARPGRPSLSKSLVIAGLVGLLAGIVLLLIVDRFDDRPTSFTDLQELFDEPVLGQIPFQKPKVKKEEVQLLRQDDDRHAFVEAYRDLHSAILYMATEGKRPKTILVTSAVPGDGKSMTTANLAITMADAGSRVLLVDADLRKGLLHRHFGLEGAPGLTEVLTGQALWANAVHPTTTPSLSLLPRGGGSRNPGKLFLSPRTDSLLKELSSQFDFVILDSAPIMAAADVTSLSTHVESVIFVIRANYTSGRIARAAMDLLYQRGVDVLSLVFNAVKTNSSDYYYYQYKDYHAAPAST